MEHISSGTSFGINTELKTETIKTSEDHCDLRNSHRHVLGLYCYLYHYVLFVADKVYPILHIFRDSIGNMTSNVTLNATAVPPEVPLFDKMQPLVYQFVILAGCVLAVGYVQIVTWSLTKERQSRRIRRLFFHSIMRQDMEWFDLNQSSELTTRMAE